MEFIAANFAPVMFAGLIGTAPVAVLAVLGETVNPLFRWVTLIVGPIVGALALSVVPVLELGKWAVRRGWFGVLA